MRSTFLPSSRPKIDDGFSKIGNLKPEDEGSDPPSIPLASDLVPALPVALPMRFVMVESVSLKPAGRAPEKNVAELKPFSGESCVRLKLGLDRADLKPVAEVALTM